MIMPYSKSLRFTLNHIKFLEHRYNRLIALITRLLLFSIALMAATQITGCNINIRAGNKPNIATLETTLKQGVSSEQDVIKALGSPVGKGREMLPFMDAPRTTWTYYYEEGDLNDDRRLFLFVFFDNQRYDGYMWFSSLPEQGSLDGALRNRGTSKP